jgi:hypothetical protein
MNIGTLDNYPAFIRNNLDDFSSSAFIVKAAANDFNNITFSYF